MSAMAGDHLVTTPLEVRQCRRCGLPVLACHVGGWPVTADPAPLDIDAYRQALIAGTPVFRIRPGVDGRPRTLAFDEPARGRDLPAVAAHPCGTDTRPLTGAAQGPTSASANSGNGKDGDHRPNAPADADKRHPATHANPRRSSGLAPASSLPAQPDADRPLSGYCGSESEAGCTSTANAENDGPGTQPPTAPHATKTSPPTETPNATAKAPTASTDIAPTPPRSDSSSTSATATPHGAARRPNRTTLPSARGPGAKHPCRCCTGRGYGACQCCGQPPHCQHGTRHCGNTDIRLYAAGYRCDQHQPGKTAT